MDRPAYSQPITCQKVGSILVISSLIVISLSSFFSVDRDFQAIVRNVGALFLVAGVVIYVVGRVIAARRARTQA